MKQLKYKISLVFLIVYFQKENFGEFIKMLISNT
jgi:hypothetical protein